MDDLTIKDLEKDLEEDILKKTREADEIRMLVNFLNFYEKKLRDIEDFNKRPVIPSLSYVTNLVIRDLTTRGII